MIYQIDGNGWLLFSAFQQGLRENLSWVFVLVQENAFSQRFPFKANRKGVGSSEKRYLRSLKYPSVYVRMTEYFERFQYFNFETNFLEKVSPFQKTGVPCFS